MITQELTPPREETAVLRMSYEEFLAWAGEDTHAEWVEGEVIEFMPAKKSHQEVMGFLLELLGFFVRLFDSGIILSPPFAMKLSKSSREPDLLFVAKKHVTRLTDNYLDGPADLVIEIVSDDSVHRDRRQKFNEYRAEGVPEYWIIDPRPGKLRADFYHLDEKGHYDLFATEDDERVASQVLEGFWLRPSWLWQAGELDPFLTFCEIRGLSPEKAQEIQQLLRSGG
ncbi:MAG: Uma2 family endonuclease [Anaerolineae bacterium]|nr:Uma2 family endonuclease [Anaerolineae bacterium]